MGSGAFPEPGAFAAAGAFMGDGAFAGLGEEPESDVLVPDEYVLLFDDESVPPLPSGEVAAAGAGGVGITDVTAGAEVPFPLVQPASSTIKPLTMIKLPLGSLMLATTPQRASRCATVMLLQCLHGRQVRYRCCVASSRAGDRHGVSRTGRSAR